MRLLLLARLSFVVPVAAALFFGAGLAIDERAAASGACTADGSALDDQELSMVNLVNDYRASKGLPTLAVSTTLNRAAAWMVNDLAANRNFGHTDSLGRSPYARSIDCGYAGGAGENLAAGADWSDARQAFQAWQASASHNTNMLLSFYTQIGVARIHRADSPYGWYWAAEFGSSTDSSSSSSTPHDPGDGAARAAGAASPGETGIRSADLVPGAWNVAKVMPGGLNVRDLQSFTAWDPQPNGRWQQWGPDEFVPGGTLVGLLPDGMTLNGGRTPR